MHRRILKALILLTPALLAIHAVLYGVRVGNHVFVIRSAELWDVLTAARLAKEEWSEPYNKGCVIVVTFTGSEEGLKIHMEETADRSFLSRGHLTPNFQYYLYRKGRLTYAGPGYSVEP